MRRALVLRDVFDSILLFEKTECPFQRSFTVELPEGPQTPVKKKPWTPIGKNLVSTSPFLSDISLPSPSGKIVNVKKRVKPAANEPDISADIAIEDDKSTEAVRPSEVSPVAVEENAASPHAVAVEAVAATESIETKAETPAESEATKDEVPERANNVQQAAQLAQEVTLDAPVTSAVPSIRVEASIPPEKEVEHDLDPKELSRAEVSQPTTPAVVRAVPITPPPSLQVHPVVISPVVDESPANISGSKPPLPILHEDMTEHLVVDQDQTRENENTSFIPTLLPSPELQGDEGSNSSAPGLEKLNKGTDEISDDTRDDGPCSFEGAGSVGTVSLKKKRMSRILAGRSVTLPQLTVVTSPSSTPTKRFSSEEPLAISTPPPVEPPATVPEEPSPNGSMDSFHSVPSWHSPVSPLPPSPPSSSPSPALFPYPHENIILPSKGVRDNISANITPITDGTLVPSSACTTVHALDVDTPASLSPINDLKSTNPSLMQSVEARAQSSALPERPGLQHRSRTTDLTMSRRTLSPLPPAGNLFSPGRQHATDRLAVVRKLPSAIIHKTVEILLSPPGHLVNLMLQVAAKIAAGEWRGLVFGLDEGGESIPVHWDYSDGELSSWEDEDDYKFSIGRLARTRSGSSSGSNGQTGLRSHISDFEDKNEAGWEVD